MTYKILAAVGAFVALAGTDKALAQVAACAADSAVNAVVFTMAGADTGIYEKPLDVHITRPLTYIDLATPIPLQYRWRLELVVPALVADIDLLPRKRGRLIERAGGPFLVRRQGECVAVMSFQMSEAWRLSVASRPVGLRMFAVVVRSDSLRVFEGTTEFRSPIARRGQEMHFRFDNKAVPQFFIKMRVTDFKAGKEVHLSKEKLQNRLCAAAEKVGQPCDDPYQLLMSRLIPAEEVVLRWEEDP